MRAYVRLHAFLISLLDTVQWSLLSYKLRHFTRGRKNPSYPMHKKPVNFIGCMQMGNRKTAVPEGNKTTACPFARHITKSSTKIKFT